MVDRALRRPTQLYPKAFADYLGFERGLSIDLMMSEYHLLNDTGVNHCAFVSRVEFYL